MPVKGSELKRTRRDRDEMEEIMFKLFERQPNWTLKQLIQETDQPEVCRLETLSSFGYFFFNFKIFVPCILNFHASMLSFCCYVSRLYIITC